MSNVKRIIELKQTQTRYELTRLVLRMLKFLRAIQEVME